MYKKTMSLAGLLFAGILSAVAAPKDSGIVNIANSVIENGQPAPTIVVYYQTCTYSSGSQNCGNIQKLTIPPNQALPVSLPPSPPAPGYSSLTVLSGITTDGNLNTTFSNCYAQFSNATLDIVHIANLSTMNCIQAGKTALLK